MYGGYTPRQKSRHYKLSFNIKIRNIFYILSFNICYIIYKEPNYFIADYNIKNNIRKFITKLQKNIIRLLYKTNLFPKKEKQIK
jgi:hypothetical protein